MWLRRLEVVLKSVQTNGTYKTEERAMEVLDMIATQSALCNAGVAVYLVDEIEKAWYMDMPEE